MSFAVSLELRTPGALLEIHGGALIVQPQAGSALIQWDPIGRGELPKPASSLRGEAAR